MRYSFHCSQQKQTKKASLARWCQIFFFLQYGVFERSLKTYLAKLENLKFIKYLYTDHFNLK